MTEEKKSRSKSGKGETPTKFSDLVEKIEKLSVLDLAELVKVLEKKFGVSAQAPIAVAGPAPAAGGETATTEEEKTIFNVELTEAGTNKIGVIKVLREVTQKGLKECKDMTDKTPTMVREGVDKAEAEAIKKKLEEAGGKVILK